MKERPSISFVLPMFNERDNITGTIEAVKSIARELTDDYEIIVVDDASTDGCGGIVEDMSKADGVIRFFRMENNTKFGGAFAKGFKSAGKDVILYMDSDLPVSTDDIKASFPLIKEADIVTGCSSVKKGETLKRKVISNAYNLIVQFMFGLNVTDINSGYKIVRRELVDDLRFISHSPFADVELFLHAKKKNGKVKQYPLVFLSRSGGKSYISGLPIILATFLDMIKVRFSLTWGVK